MRTDQLTGILENLFGELMHGVSGKGGFMLNHRDRGLLRGAGLGERRDFIGPVHLRDHRFLDKWSRRGRSFESKPGPICSSWIKRRCEME